MAVTKYCQKDGNFISNFYKLNPWSLALDPEKSYEILLRLLRRKDGKVHTLLRANQKRQSEVKSEESLNSRNPSLTLRTGKEKSCPCFF